jgi:hypothetical protein
MYCSIKWLSIDVSEMRTASIIPYFVIGLGLLRRHLDKEFNWIIIPDDGGSTHLWNVGRQSFYTAVHPRRLFWTSLRCSSFTLYRGHVVIIIMIIQLNDDVTAQGRLQRKDKFKREKRDNKWRNTKKWTKRGNLYNLSQCSSARGHRYGIPTPMNYSVRWLASRPTPVNFGGPMIFCWGYSPSQRFQF